MHYSTRYEKEADDSGYIYFKKNIIDNSTHWNRGLIHFHDSIEIAVIVKGCCVVHINMEERTLSEGDIAIIDSFSSHFYMPSVGNEHYVALISSKYFGGANKFDKMIFPAFLGKSEGFNEVKNLFDFVHGVGGTTNEALKTGFANMLFGILEKYYPLQRRERGKETEVLVQTLQYINDNYSKEINLQFLADKYGYSLNYFSALFNKFTGMNLREYVNRRRICAYMRLKAKEPLLPACKAAELCGFVSLNTFYRALERYKDGNNHNF